MLRRHLVERGISDARVLEAMATVPREQFVAPECRDRAYDDGPLPIGEGQTISQPYVVAWMAETVELGREDRVLEIGTGSGYAAAVLSRIARTVHSVERHAALAEAARDRLRQLGYANVRIRRGDGTLGWSEHAPYDAIVVSAGGRRVPRPLREQLTVGGRLVMPVGWGWRGQSLVRERHERPGRFTREKLGRVRFVPLIGEAG
ncbi:MAG: protein-L-isoaspartate(D-aspartate) O-methyltransferase [Gemmatimonadota bacterium]|nr:protein-L-isoaspartate(D-aspartate) O-methyltransferase [Gemmatimonadota bacterium]